MRRRMIRVAIAGAGLLGVVAAASCGDSQRADDTTTAPTEPASTTDSVERTTSSTTASTSSSTSAPATTVPSDDPLALRPTGIGAVEFGDGADAVISALEAELGAPSDDRTETAFSSSYGVCPGEQVRVVEWGGFVVLFSDGETPFSAGGDSTFFDWRLRDLGAATPPLQTPEGIDLGDTTAAVRAAFGPSVTVHDDDVLGPSFRVGAYPDELRGTLTATSDSGTVTALEAGSSCGE